MKYSCRLLWTVTSFLLSFSLVFLGPVIAFSQNNEVVLGKVKADFSVDDGGRIYYSISYADKAVIKNSRLGFIVKGKDSAFCKGFKIIGSSVREADTKWKPVWGETAEIRDHYKELQVQLEQKNAPHYLLNIIFKVFEDGVGFKYEFPEQPNLEFFVVEEELTSFQMAGDHKTFWIPGDYDSNEYLYTTSKISEIDNRPVVKNASGLVVQTVPDRYTVQTPLMMKTQNALYINIHEAALVNYPAMQLHANRDKLLFSASLVPDAVGNKAYLHAPFSTPWRTVIISDKAADILLSKIILNLNQPSVIQETSWIKPMKFIGVWWEMQTGKGSWSYAANAKARDTSGKLIPNGIHSANTDNVKKYIDFAAANNIGGVLVEGWNIGWEDWFGNWKEDVFDFVTPYPDFDIRGLADYAKRKKVQLIMHNETFGSATNYERLIDTAFRFMKANGYNYVKTGYVGRIIPRGEHHDGQWMVNHYERVAKKAAQYQVMFDAHESVRPTGLHRTYSNWLACEAARGMESCAFSNGNPPEHETILPFTRLIGGPMDYTPGIFKLQGFSADTSRKVSTTLCKQLALYVTMYSPIQMAADLPENYMAHADAFNFIKQVPVDWDDTKVLEAEPGDYITIARKEKGKNNWYIGAITDEQSRIANISLDFLEKGKKYIATLYIDNKNSSFRVNPEGYHIEKKEVDATQMLRLQLASGGGCAISILGL